MAREDVVQHYPASAERAQFGNLAALTLKLSGYTTDEQQLFRNLLLDTLYASIPKDPEIKVLVFHAEIVPGGFTNWHCHNGATFFVALQGRFEAFEQGISSAPRPATSTPSRSDSFIAVTIPIRPCRISASASVSPRPTRNM